MWCLDDLKGSSEGCTCSYLGTGETEAEGRDTKVELALIVFDDAGEALSKRTIGAKCNAWWTVDTVCLRALTGVAGELGGAWGRW